MERIPFIVLAFVFLFTSGCTDDDEVQIDLPPELVTPALDEVADGEAMILTNGADFLDMTGEIRFAGFGEGPTRESWTLTVSKPDTTISITLSVPADGAPGASIREGKYNISEGPVEEENYLVLNLKIGERSYTSGGNGSSGEGEVTNLLPGRNLDLSFNVQGLYELTDGFPNLEGKRINIAGVAKLR